MSNDALETLARPRRVWRWPIGWLTLFAVAWVVYELTHSPGIASVLICLKFGWDDFLTARWLWLNDPIPSRRRSLYWLNLAWGTWKTTVVAFLMSVAYAAITPRNLPQGVPQALMAFLGTFLTTLGGFFLTALLTTTAVVSAWWGGHRLWLDPAVSRARRYNFWPPTPFCEGHPNRLGTLVVATLALLAFATLLVTLTLTPRPMRGMVFGLFLAIVAPVALGVIREWILGHVRAEEPSECWPEEWDNADA